MKIFAISDLHLSGAGVSKPMDVFGTNWAGYMDEIRKHWIAAVSGDDIVLVGGDSSWAMTLDEAQPDLDCIGALPGKKILVRGNHDYWWKSISNVRAALKEGTYALQNDSMKFGNTVVCGTRGWTVPEPSGAAEEDIKIYNREIERLKLSLKNAASKRGAGDTLICLMHFPPFNSKYGESGFTALFREWGVDKVVYGHLHGPYGRAELYLKKDGTEYYLTSCDKLKNKLARIV